MQTICDTNIFIKLFKDDETVKAELAKIGSNNILMPSITAMELYQGMQNKVELRAMIRKIRYFNLINLNEAASEKAIEIIAEYKLSHGIAIPDALIGAIALTYDLELYTYNIKDFHYLPNIKLRPLP